MCSFKDGGPDDQSQAGYQPASIWVSVDPVAPAGKSKVCVAWDCAHLARALQASPYPPACSIFHTYR
jgi:hypothetical protein